MRWIFRHVVVPIVINALALWLTQYIFANQGFAISGGWWGLLLVGAVLGVLNTILKPLLKIFSFPFTFMTMGLFGIVINGLVLLAVRYFFHDLFAETFAVRIELGESFLAMVLVVMALSAVNGLLHFVLRMGK